MDKKSGLGVCLKVTVTIYIYFTLLKGEYTVLPILPKYQNSIYTEAILETILGFVDYEIMFLFT